MKLDSILTPRDAERVERDDRATARHAAVANRTSPDRWAAFPVMRLRGPAAVPELLDRAVILVRGNPANTNCEKRPFGDLGEARPEIVRIPPVPVLAHVPRQLDDPSKDRQDQRRPEEPTPWDRVLPAPRGIFVFTCGHQLKGVPGFGTRDSHALGSRNTSSSERTLESSTCNTPRLAPPSSSSMYDGAVSRPSFSSSQSVSMSAMEGCGGWPRRAVAVSPMDVAEGPRRRGRAHNE
jgi:hypothetical protein